jgi:hypothetical protein
VADLSGGLQALQSKPVKIDKRDPQGSFKARIKDPSAFEKGKTGKSDPHLCSRFNQGDD